MRARRQRVNRATCVNHECMHRLAGTGSRGDMLLLRQCASHVAGWVVIHSGQPGAPLRNAGQQHRYLSWAWVDGEKAPKRQVLNTILHSRAPMFACKRCAEPDLGLTNFLMILKIIFRTFVFLSVHCAQQVLGPDARSGALRAGSRACLKGMP